MRDRARDVGEGLVFGELELCHTGGGVQVVQSHRTFCPQLVQQLVKAVVGLLGDQNVTRRVEEGGYHNLRFGDLLAGLALCLGLLVGATLGREVNA